MTGPRTKDEAQRRADQIAAFRAELLELEREGAALEARQLDPITAHHDHILQTLVRDFDVDRGDRDKRMSVRVVTGV